MARVNDTGESSASIRRRQDDHVWPTVEEALRGGASLRRPTGLRDFYTFCKDDRDPKNGIGLSAGRVKRLEDEGVLQRVGVDTYALVSQVPA